MESWRGPTSAAAVDPGRLFCCLWSANDKIYRWTGYVGLCREHGQSTICQPHVRSILTDRSSTPWLRIHYSATTITSTRFASKANTRESRYKTPAGSLSYMHRCHPRYLGVKAHSKLSRPGAFDGLRIHTDEINEVIARMTPSTLSVAVVSYASRRYPLPANYLAHGFHGLVRSDYRRRHSSSPRSK
jgi:hypothetical protein